MTKIKGPTGPEPLEISLDTARADYCRFIIKALIAAGDVSEAKVRALLDYAVNYVKWNE